MARSLKAAGFECTIFDKALGPGGLWRENYPGFGLQVTKQLYEFPDFPNPAPRGKYLNGPEVQAYIESFVDKFGLQTYFKGGVEVTELSRRDDNKPGWTFKIRESDGSQKEEKFDFAVVATGMFSTTPYVPEVKGRQGFEARGGKVLHTSEVRDVEIARGKSVVVVGGGKSAIDNASAISDVAKSTTLLYREPHWGVPRKIAALIPFHWIFASRLGQGLIVMFKGSFPKVAPIFGRMHYVMWWIMRPVFGIVEALFAFQLGHYGNYKPELDIVKDVYYAAHILDSTFLEKRKSGAIEAVKGEIDELQNGSVLLKDGSTKRCDIVIFGTGFGKSYSYFTEDVTNALNVQDDGLYLYKQMIPPNVADLAFCGSEIATLYNITTYGMQAEWITRMLCGSVKLPSAAEMEDEVNANMKWKRSWMVESRARAQTVLLHQIHYHQSLLKDMGEKTHRLGLGEYFMPYECAHYDGVVGKAKMNTAT